MFSFFKVKKAEKEIRRFLYDYKARCAGNNRFLVDEEILRKTFPEYSEEVIRKVWIRLTDSKAIEKDSMDGAWCIK